MLRSMLTFVSISFVSIVNIACAEQDNRPPPLPIEELGRVETLPDTYPESWVFVDEASFFSMFGGKVIVLDIAEKKPANRIKGLVDKNLLGNFTQANSRNEFYIMETFHERGSRGKRTDVLVIYDKKTLSIKKEIIWDEVRLIALPLRYAMAVSDDDRFLYVTNFSPATSITVVDLNTYEVVDTIATPGCVLTYPGGNRKVTSICNNGGLLTTVIDDKGQKKAQHRLEPFFDSDDSPVFERPVIVDGIAHFPGFKSEMHSIDLRSDKPTYHKAWSLLNEDEKQTNWRPGGLALTDVDDNGLMYIIMNPDGAEGTHSHGGSEIWVFDLKTQKRVNRIVALNWAISLAVTRGDNPLLVVTNGELNLDVFNASTGKLIQTVGDFGNTTPLLVHKSK